MDCAANNSLCLLEQILAPYLLASLPELGSRKRKINTTKDQLKAAPEF